MAEVDELNLPANELLSHGAPRLVYVMNAIGNLMGYLLGMEKRPKWIVGGGGKKGEAAGVTGAIADFWKERWLRGRLGNEGAMERVRGNTLVYPVRHGARVVLPRELTGQMEIWEGET